MIKRTPKKQPSSRAVGYVRRSTDRQEQSIEDQKKALQDYADEHGLALVKFYTDDAISGTSTLGRRAFQQMIEDATGSAQSFDKIIVYDIKRFGRIDNDEAGYYRHILRTHGVEVCYVSENFNGDSTDDLLRPVKQWQARQESKDLSKVTIRGLLSKVEGGWWMGGVPPYGYDLRYEGADGKFLFVVRFMPDGSKQILDEKGKFIRTLARGESLNISKRDQAKLTPGSPDRVKVIKQIFKMYVEEGKGYKSIAHTLNQQGIPTARGPEWSYIYSGKWTDTTIRAILVNPTYVGDMVWNRRTDARFHKISGGIAIDRKDIHGHRLVPNDENDWFIIRDAHKPLVSRRLFELTKQKRNCKPQSIEQKGLDPRLKSHGKTWHGKRSRFILSGLLICAKCGSRYQGITRSKGKLNLDGTRTKNFYYGCGGYISRGKSVCELNLIKKEALENIIIKEILQFYSKYLEDDGRELLAQEIKSQTEYETKDIKSARQRAANELQRVEGIINNLLDNLTETNRQFVDERLNDLKKQKQQLETRLEEFDKLESSQANVQDIASEALKFTSSLEYIFRNGLPQEKLAVIRQCIEKIYLDGENKKIKLKIRTVPVSNLQTYHELSV